MTDYIVEESLPHQMRRKVDWEGFVAAVENADGRWVSIGDPHPGPTATRIRQGKYKHIDPQRFDVTSSQAGTTSRLYVRLRGGTYASD